MAEPKRTVPTTKPSALQTASTLLGGVALVVVGLAACAAGYLLLGSGRPLAIGLGAWALAAVRGVFHLHITRDDLFKLGPIITSTATNASMVVVFDALVLRVTPALFDIVAIGVMISVGLGLGLQLGRAILLSMWRQGEFRTTAVVAGSGDVARQLRLELEHRPDLGIDVVGFVRLNDDDADGDLLSHALHGQRPDRLILGETLGDDQRLLPALRKAGVLGTGVYVLPRLFEMGLGNPLFTPDRLRGFPLVRANRPAHPRLSIAIKRAFDIAVSALGLVAVMPLLVVAALAVRLTSPGPALYWQERIGQHGKTFRVPKLRSMTCSDSGDTDWTAESRITPVGRVLRRTAIDELPQLVTVLRGDMSLVGPRPERPAFVEQFSSEHAEYANRLRMRSGLTGLSQIAGLRGDTPISERIKYDNLYIDQWSFGGDLSILLRTVIAIIKEGSYAQAHLEFDELIRLDDAEHIDLRPNLLDVQRVEAP